MDVTVRSRHVELTEALRAVAREKVSRLSRFLEGMEHAEVLFSEERNPRISAKEVCEVTVTGHGHVVRARAADADAVAAIDRVVDKLEHRLAKLKGKLVARSHPRRHGSLDSAPDLSRAPAGVEVDDEEGQPRIVKTKQFAIKPMTPEEAALQMDLLGHDFFLFTNAETGSAAVVYRRNDGHIGLIEGA